MRRRWALSVLFGLVAILPCLAMADPLPDGLYAEFSTSMGTFTCELDYTGTPRTVANFVMLTEGDRGWLDVGSGRAISNAFYEGTTFHRVITNFMIQAGIPAVSGNALIGFKFSDEFTTPSSTLVVRGVLAMANAGPDTNSSQFFIPVTAQPHLNGVHTVFGNVVAGMDVVDDISLVPTTGSEPVTPVVIHSVTILRIGTDAGNWNPAGVTPPLPVPVGVVRSRLTGELGELTLTWDSMPGLGQVVFYDYHLPSVDVDWWGYDSSGVVSNYTATWIADQLPHGSFWVFREGRD